MGITGLLPLLEKGKVSRPTNIKEFKGCTVAADAYCWLHKGAFACADKLARGEETDMFVQYCMKYVNLLLANDIKPILVFDGRHLPAKAQTEKKRRERREENRKQAANLLRQGHSTEALAFLRRCIDVTHKMALTVMQECRRRNVDCIVAPYEADAQLAFFSIEGIADLIVTEDSDLLLFGCKKVMFKLDLSGNGVLVDQTRLYLSMGSRPESYSFEKFRYMCILSGCDYLDSLPGIGLGKACKFMSRTQDPDIHKALCRLPLQLNIRGLSVSMDYRDDFMKADAMFKHQLVFDPRSKRAKPLTPHQSVHAGSPLAAGPLPGCVPEFDDDTCFQLALGNLDPFKLEKVDNYDPSAPRDDNGGVKTKGWNQTAVASHPSIWDPQFMEKMAKQKPKPAPSFMPCDTRPVTKGKMQAFDTKLLAKSDSRKRTIELDDDDDELEKVKRPSIESSDSKLTDLYSNSPKIVTESKERLSPTFESPNTDVKDLLTSPILSSKRTSRNPFARSLKNEDTFDCVVKEEPSVSPVTSSSKQPNKFGALSKFARAIQRTTTEGKPIVQSRYFDTADSTLVENPNLDEDISPRNLLCDISNTVEECDEKESHMIQAYRKGSELDTKSPMIHKRPLFASMNSLKDSKDKTENDSVIKCDSSSGEDILSTFHEKFKKQDSGLKSKISPSKNPFKKGVQKENNSGNTDVGESMNSSFGLRQLYADDKDVDDPGFESSASLTPCSPSKALSDDGFESPSKICSPPLKWSPPSQKKPQSSSKLKNSSCRMPGLKKPLPVGSGQSKLSAFGFTPKPKIQRSQE